MLFASAADDALTCSAVSLVYYKSLFHLKSLGKIARFYKMIHRLKRTWNTDMLWTTGQTFSAVDAWYKLAISKNDFFVHFEIYTPYKFDFIVLTKTVQGFFCDDILLNLFYPFLK